MNSYFDDNTQTVAPGSSAGTTTQTPSPAASVSDKNALGTEIDTDLSKLFAEDNKVVSAEATPAPVADSKTGLNPVSKPAGDNFTINKPLETMAAETEDLTFDKTPEPKTDEPAKKAETFTPATAKPATGSLSETEAKLNSKKDDLSKQITEIEEKKKKVDEMLAKISDLKKQEDDILKSAEAI